MIRQYPSNRVRTPYAAGKPLKQPGRRRVEWFGAYRRELVARYGLTDAQALRDAYDLAGLYVEWRQTTEDLAGARRRQEARETPVPAVRTLQKRMALSRRDYRVALEAFEARWGRAASHVPSPAELLAIAQKANGHG